MDEKALTIPTPSQLKRQHPLSQSAATFILNAKAEAKRIALRKEKRIALVVGPCSVHDFGSVIEYAKELKKLKGHVEKKFFLIMRAFIEKSRTKTGWKGLVYDPHLDTSHQMSTGLIWARKLLIQLAEMEIACCMEFVDPLVAKYFDDLIVWGFIGARTTSSQLHRQYVSHLAIPVGFKNTIDGNIDIAACSVASSQSSHSFLYINDEGKLCQIVSQGNPYTHVVLRGSLKGSNCDGLSIEQALLKIKHHGLRPNLMVDCSHGNSDKNPMNQETNFERVINQVFEGNESIFGIMLESHLNYGHQIIQEDLKFGVSVTDSCLDWGTTQKLILKAANKISQSFSYAL